MTLLVALGVPRAALAPDGRTDGVTVGGGVRVAMDPHTRGLPDYPGILGGWRLGLAGQPLPEGQPIRTWADLRALLRE